MVLELSSDVATPAPDLAPHHYIFLVDVSGSMNSKLGSKTLLERVKVRANQNTFGGKSSNV